MNNLEKRIREVASRMEGKFMGTVPHSVFVEWDATWDIAEEIDPEWGSPCNEDSTDEEIEDCILYREGCCDECYKDGVEAYGLVEAFKEGARTYAEDSELPSDRELVKVAMKVIAEEKETAEIRKEALETKKQMDWDAFHQPQSNYEYPNPKDCPVDEFCPEGGYLYYADKDYTLEQAMCICMKDAYVCWFDEHTVQKWR